MSESLMSGSDGGSVTSSSESMLGDEWGGTLTNVSNGVLMGYLYRMKTLSGTDGTDGTDGTEGRAVLAEVMHRHQIGNNLGGSAHRMRYIVALCKEITQIPLLAEETESLRVARARFNHIEDIPTLDLCLLFWLITQDPRHQLQLQHAIYTPTSPVRTPAQLLLLNYPNLIRPSNFDPHT